MKKILLIAVVLLMASALAFAGGGKDKGGAAGSGEPPFIVDLSTLQQLQVINQDNSTVGGPIPGLRNPVAFVRNWQGLIIQFPENFVDVTKYTRVTITLKFFNKDGEEIPPADSMGMLVLIYDIKGDWHGPEMGSGPNTPLKEMNVGGFSGLVNKERGSRHNCSRAPQAIFIQKAQDARVAFIELSGVIFHNGNFKFAEEQPQGEGPQG